MSGEIDKSNLNPEEYAMETAMETIRFNREALAIVRKDLEFYQSMDSKEKFAFINSLTQISRNNGDMIAKIIKYATDTKNIYLKQKAMELLQSGTTSKKRIEPPPRACHYIKDANDNE